MHRITPFRKKASHSMRSSTAKSTTFAYIVKPCNPLVVFNIESLDEFLNRAVCSSSRSASSSRTSRCLYRGQDTSIGLKPPRVSSGACFRDTCASSIRAQWLESQTQQCIGWCIVKRLDPMSPQSRHWTCVCVSLYLIVRDVQGVDACWEASPCFAEKYIIALRYPVDEN